MPLKIIRQDITKIECDAIVNPSNSQLFPGGGTDLAIHKAAGKALLEACKKLGGCEIGSAKLTKGYLLPCKYVIHTASPLWENEQESLKLLASCYRESLLLAIKKGCKSLAFPLIGAGTNGAPRAEVLRIASAVIGEFLYENELLVYLVVYDKDSFEIGQKLFCDISAYIDDNYVKDEENALPPSAFSIPQKCLSRSATVSVGCGAPQPELALDEYGASLDDMIKNMDKGFAETLFFYIDKKGISDVECYKRSNVDKRTFSKIKSQKGYRPSKATAVSFAIGLRLDFKQTEHLLRTAGFCLSNNILFDVIIKYFVTTGNYESIFDVNEALYKFDQATLGV